MKLIINPKAELKIRIAMKHAKIYEIMWFGEIHKNKTGNFILKDVLFPPQENQIAFVTTDDKRFPKWIFNHIVKKNKAKDIRLHGHTHPTFNTNPSAIDKKHIDTFLKESKDYYIQMILSNEYKPYCVLHTKTKTGYTTKKLPIIWNYTLKIKKVMIGVMNINEPQQTSGVL